MNEGVIRFAFGVNLEGFFGDCIIVQGIVCSEPDNDVMLVHIGTCIHKALQHIQSVSSKNIHFKILNLIT